MITVKVSLEANMINTVDVDQNITSSAEQMFDGSFSIETDPFWSEQNQARLQESLLELNAGKVIIKTTAELEAMENG
jgi:hypothetical protein